MLRTLKKPYYDWTLNEVLECTGFIKDNILGNRYFNRAIYMSKINGMVNRTKEIIQRLHCSNCNALLNFNLEYAKKFNAAYSVTHAYCPNSLSEDNHDNDVYFNHCVNCGQIIDSRESMQHPDGYYICEECGAHKNGDWGDSCPKCLAALNEYGICSNCGYHIDINGHNRKHRRLSGCDYRVPF